MVPLVSPRCITPAAVALLLVATQLAPRSLTAQDSVPPPRPSAGARLGARLLVVFRPPARGTRRERVLTRGEDGARALIPAERVDSLVPQTLRAQPFVAVCVSGQPDSARLTVRVLPDSAGNGGMSAGAMVGLVPGLNRLALNTVDVPLADGALAEWSLSTRSGEVFLSERIQRQVVRATPTVNSLARNGIWYDALDLFVADAIRGIPLGHERLATFLTSVGAAPCSRAAAR
ncbi:MAG: hypothetical protein IT355_08505 [Gemmatimonadaceae bacterium]|nr:hypothetical protein [Gemmatimonadaceae bacterium]